MSDTANIKINLSMTADFQSPSCTPIIKFENNKLKILPHKLSNKNIPVKVISIIGNGRTGKSTFLNCFATYLTKSNMDIFHRLKTNSWVTNANIRKINGISKAEVAIYLDGCCSWSLIDLRRDSTWLSIWPFFEKPSLMVVK